jgi:hypothetical protein
VSLDEIQVSESLASYVKGHPSLEIIEGPHELVFDGEGNLF